MAAISAAIGVTASIQIDDPASSIPLYELPAPIVIESDDDSIDADDPVLIDEMRDIHDDFVAGQTTSAASAINPDYPFAAAVNSGLSLSYDAGHPSPSNVQTVVGAAAAKWDAAIATTAATPVEIAIIWTDLGNPNLLGSAGPAGLYSGGALPAGAYVPAPLANVMLGYDVNGSGTAELTVNLNSGANWYVGTGTPSSGQVDLYSVVLHEMGHGLGFLGSGSLYNHTPNTTPTLEDTPFVYDQQVTYGGAPLLSHGSPDSLLRSQNLFIKLSDTLSNKIYAPGSWQEGSSFSHFDESSYPAGSAGALMTPSLGGGEVERTIDAATLGVLARTGWPMRVGAAKPLIKSKASASGQVSVSWIKQLEQAAVAPDSYRVQASVGSSVHGSKVVSAATSSTTIAGLNNGTTYTVSVIPVVDGVDGTRSATTIATPSVVGAPRAIAVNGSGTTRTLTWLKGDGLSPTSYDVQSSRNGGSWTSHGSSSGLSKTVSLSEGVYQFRVRGRSGSKIGDWGYSIPTGIDASVVRPVALDGQISRLYQAYFLREPDRSGFIYWRNTRAAGADLGAISEAFARSGEFVNTYGSLTNAQFVDLVYQNVLDRPADSSGRAHWINQLNRGANRGSVMIGFSESAEFINKTGTADPQTAVEGEINRLYMAFFLRTPDASGLAHWVSVRNGGASLEAIAAAFAASTEFQSTYGSLSNADFVELVYNNVLARQPDGTGGSYWQSLLASGTNRGSMMVGFAESQEFIIATGTVP